MQIWFIIQEMRVLQRILILITFYGLFWNKNLHCFFGLKNIRNWRKIIKIIQKRKHKTPSKIVTIILTNYVYFSKSLSRHCSLVSWQKTSRYLYKMRKLEKRNFTRLLQHFAIMLVWSGVKVDGGRGNSISKQQNSTIGQATSLSLNHLRSD